MAAPALAYVKDVNRRYRKYWPTWWPTTRLKIGDCGPLEDGVLFDRKRHATDFGVSRAALRTLPAPRDPLLLVRSSKAIRVKKRLRAGNILLPGIPEGEAGAQVTFLRENATFLAAVEVSERRVADKYKLEQELTALVQAGDFPPHYVVITDLVTARSARIFISSERGDSVTVSGELDAPLGLAGIGAKLTTVVDNTVDLTFDGTRGVTPLYRPMGFMIGGKIRRLKRRLLSRGPRRRVPRIVFKSLDVKPSLGKPITVRPIEGDAVAIYPVERPPFVMESAALKPFTVEPIMVDAGVIGAVIPGLEAPHPGSGGTWGGALARGCRRRSGSW